MGLFSPKWLTDHYETKKLDDESKLEKAYLKGKNHKVRLAAVRRISDVSFLKGILVSIPSSIYTDEKQDIAIAAVDRLVKLDQNVLGQITTVRNQQIRELAARQLTDQTVLAKVATENDYWKIRETACKKLNDQTVLANIMFSEKNENVLFAAVWRLNDQETLARVANSSLSPDIRGEAIKRLSDADLAAGFLLKDKNERIQKASLYCLKTLKNKDSLNKASENTDDNSIKEEIAEILAEIGDHDNA